MAVDAMSERIQDISSAITGKKNLLNSLKNNLVSAKGILQALQAKKKELELEAADKDKLIRKHHSELNTLKSNDAYKAMMEEIKTAKEAFVSIEDQELVVMEKIEAAQTDLKQKEEKVKSDEGKLSAEIQSLESEKNKIEDEKKAKIEERNEFFKTIPGDLSRHYENVRSRRGGAVLSAVVNQTCVECNMKITHNQMVQLKKGKTIEYCEQSSRILYLPEQLQENKSDQPAVSSQEPN